MSEEDGQHEGLGLLPGRVVRFESSPGLKIPHMGWNTLRVLRPSPLLAGLGPDPSVYFVHSYYARPDRPDDVVAESDHPHPFAAIVWRDNLMACQFHPEKSQRVGLAMYANFAASLIGGGMSLVVPVDPVYVAGFPSPAVLELNWNRIRFYTEFSYEY